MPPASKTPAETSAVRTSPPAPATGTTPPAVTTAGVAPDMLTKCPTLNTTGRIQRNKKPSDMLKDYHLGSLSDAHAENGREQSERNILNNSIHSVGEFFKKAKTRTQSSD